MHVLIAALHRPLKPTGVCRHAVNLANCLAQRSDITQISLIIGVWQQDYFAQAFAFPSQKIKLINVDIKNSSLARNNWFLWGLPQLVKKINPDIVHLSFPLPFFKGKFSIPIVATIHDLYPYECPENFGFPQVWFNRLFLKQCINNSDGLACVSRITLDRLKFYFPYLKAQQIVEVIYNYVDLNLECSAQKAPPPLLKSSSFLLTVAQHRQNKNLDLLIKAFAKLLNTRQIDGDYQLVIVGSSGPETKNIQDLIRELALETQVLLLSAISDRELCWLYQNCRAFVISSSTEGFCLPLAEALYLKRRVVCSDIPIFREVGSTECTYFSLEDKVVDNLVRAIAQSLDKSPVRDSSSSERFNKSKIAQQYLNLYSRLV